MNEFTVKKIAEVYGFGQLALIISERSGGSLAVYAPGITEQLGGIDAALPDQNTVPHQAIFAPKVEKTRRKLTTMMELYIGDEWDNPVEMLEWLSFYAGAGRAHAALASRACREYELAEPLHIISTQFADLLDTVTLRLAQTGAERSRD